MTVVAVIGAGSLVGRAVLGRLQAAEDVELILGIDVVEPEMPVAKLEFRPVDVRDRLLPLALDGADAVVHCGLALEPERDEDAMLARTVHGTRNVLDAAAKVGAHTLVVVTSAGVYGARPDNPLPLDEDAAPRAAPAFAAAHQLRLAEQLVEEWADDHPGVGVTVLRPALVLGAGGWLDRHLALPRLPLVGGQCAPMQFVSPDDVAAAVQLAVVGRLGGTFNVAADGWVTGAEVAGLLGRRTVRVPEETAFGAARLLWARGLSHLPPGALPTLMYPSVVATERLRARGWTPSSSNRELLREFAARRRERAPRRRAVAVAVIAAVLLPAGWIGARRVGPWRIQSYE